MIALIAAALVFVSAPDGDTLTVRDTSTNGETVLRLAEVDAPERTQPYSQVSRRNLVAMCKDKPLSFKRVSTDRYGRTVAMVMCDAVVVNWRQVHDGLAWCFTRYLTQPAICLPLESEAKNAKRGLWRDLEPTAPWTFRADKRASTTIQP